MASIDKTYTNNYSEYRKFKNWADKQTVTFFDGHKEGIGDWVWDIEEKYFGKEEIPIMNTPTWIDIFLLQNCKSKFVLDRLKAVYPKLSIQAFKSMEFPCKLPNGYEQGRKVIINTIPGKTKLLLCNKPYKSRWWLQCEDVSWDYNDETKRWVKHAMYYPSYSNTSHHKTVKSLVRFLRKQYLPKGLKFRLNGIAKGEIYEVKIK